MGHFFLFGLFSINFIHTNDHHTSYIFTHTQRIAYSSFSNISIFYALRSLSFHFASLFHLSNIRSIQRYFCHFYSTLLLIAITLATGVRVWCGCSQQMPRLNWWSGVLMRTQARKRADTEYVDVSEKSATEWMCARDGRERNGAKYIERKRVNYGCRNRNRFIDATK